MDLAELLQQEVVAAKIIGELDDAKRRAIRLTGPPGCGKSSIARLVARAWVKSGGGCVVTVGDEGHASRSLYPLLAGASERNVDWGDIASHGTRTAFMVAGAAAGGAGTGGSVFDLLSAASRQRLERILRPYSTPERTVLLDLRRLARRRRVLLIADNAHWWDGDSLNLVYDVLDQPLREAIPQLASIAVLIVDTSADQTITAPAPFSRLVGLAGPHLHSVPGCTEKQFTEALSLFGLEHPLPVDLVHTLFTVTGGHLKLAEQVAAYFQHDPASAYGAAVDASYLATLLAARFSSLGNPPEVSNLLIRAAILGLSFSEAELHCISDARRTVLRSLIRQAEEIGFLERDPQRISFSHDIIRRAIVDGPTTEQLPDLYLKLAGCLATLRPGEYVARADALLRAGDTDAEREMLALASVADLRQGVAPARVIQNASDRRPDDSKLLAYVEFMSDAYRTVNAGGYAAALPRLRTGVSAETPLMAAERNYLAALCCMELQTRTGVTDARSILGGWLSSLDKEDELYQRFMLLLQQAQVLAELFDEARTTESDVERRLLDRARYDPEAGAALQVQNRRAAAVNVPEVAEVRIEDAVAFFRRGTGSPLRDQIELYRALNNLAAIKIRLGKDAEAYDVAHEAEVLAVESPDLVRRVDVVASNLVLASLRAGRLDPRTASERQRVVVDSPEGSDDKFIHRCNLGGYLLLAKSDADAARELDSLASELDAREFDESYLVFYCTTLLVASLALRGEQDEAIARHRAMAQFVDALRWPCAAYVRRRHQLLEERLVAGPLPASRRDADRVVLDVYPYEVGPGWSYYARLMPLAELSFWSES